MTANRRTGSDEPGGEAALELGYGEALAELEEILDDLDRPDVDVDELSLKVQRASVLIRHCRERISSARLEIEQVVADLDESAPGG
jgi:exodeoxyribonuclease VII small subunit